MTKPTAFRETKKAEDIINKYMNVHHIANRSLAINQIIEAFQSEPKITPGAKTDDWICKRGLPKHPDPQQQFYLCEHCRIKYHKEWRACKEQQLRST